MENKMDPRRTAGLDFAKYICAFMVICIHVSYGGKTYLEPLTRFAVPVFFMINGYFHCSVQKRGRETARIKKCALLLGGVCLLYLVWGISACLIQGESLNEYAQSFLEPKTWLNFVVFCDVPFGMHLWYLQVLIYVLFTLFLLDRYGKRKWLYRLIPVLLLLNVALGTYSSYLFGRRLPLIYSRNFLLMGLPFYLLGDWFREKQVKPNGRRALFWTAIFMVTSAAENLRLLNTGRSFNVDCFFSTPLLSCSVFLLFLSCENRMGNRWLSAIAFLGRRTSTTVYIMHPIIQAVLGKMVGFAGRFLPALPEIYLYVAPLAALLCSTVFALIINAVKNQYCRQGRLCNHSPQSK